MVLIYYSIIIILIFLFNIFNDIILHIKFFPNLFLILSIYITITKGQNFGQIFGFILGLIFDSFNIFVFGTSSFIWTVYGFFIGKFRGYIEKSNLLAQFFLMFFLDFIYLLLAQLFNNIFGELSINYFSVSNILRLFIDASVFVIIFPFLDFLERILVKNHNY